MKRTMLCLLIISFIMSLTVVHAQKTDMIPLDARLDIIAGQVKLTRIGSTKTDVVTQSINLFAGDLLEALRGSKATLSYKDGTTMRIKERTLIEVQPMSLKIFKGKTWFKFTKRGSEFKIETPTLVAGIRGTKFEVAVTSRKKTSLSVTEGAVAVRGGKSNRKMLVRAGFATHCESEGNLVPAYKFNVERKNAEWTDTEWATNSTDDINRMFIRYLNLKYEYGDDDIRTEEAFKELEAMKNTTKK